MKFLNFNLNELDIIYILNCIALTRNLLYKGDSSLFGDYFDKLDYTENNWNLWLLQKMLIIKGNEAIYESNREDMFWRSNYIFGRRL